MSRVRATLICFIKLYNLKRKDLRLGVYWTFILIEICLFPSQQSAYQKEGLFTKLNKSLYTCTLVFSPGPIACLPYIYKTKIGHLIFAQSDELNPEHMIASIREDKR